MARFNQPQTKLNPRRTTNEEGAVAYVMSPEELLYTTLMTGTLSSRFYDDRATKQAPTLARIAELGKQIEKCDTNFVINMLEYARTEGNMRTGPCVGIVLLALQNRLTKEMVPRVARRADEPLEIAAIWKALSGNKDLKHLPNALKNGLALAESRLLNEYTAGKYQGKGIKHLDLLRMCHPKPKDVGQAKVFGKIKKDTIPTPSTWETMISAAGSDPEKKRTAWEVWIDKHMTYMAALRNLRNIIEADVSRDHFAQVISFIGNQEIAAKAKQFPFRFWSAYRMLTDTSHPRGLNAPKPVDMKSLFDALEMGIQASVGAIPGWEFLQTQRILIAADVSGSMMSPLTAKSSVEYYHVALLLGYLLQTQIPQVTVGMFGNKWKPLEVSRTVLDATMQAYRREGEVGYSTNAHAVIRWALEKNIEYDLFMFFSDMQMWNDSTVRGFKERPGRSPLEQVFNEYKSKMNPKAKMVLFNLAGYETVPLDLVRKDVAMVAGWSDKIFQVLGDLFEGKNFLDRFRKVC